MLGRLGRWFTARRRLRRYTLHWGERERFFLLSAPRTGRRSGALPLVMVLHGGGGGPRAMARMTRVHAAPEAAGMVVAYPAGTSRWPRRRRRLDWNAGGRHGVGRPEQTGIDDVGFLRAVVQRIAEEYPIDAKRVYVTGISKGGMMAYRMACEAADLISAVAVVSGSLTTDECRPGSQVSVLHIHGTVDANVPLAGGAGRYTKKGNRWPAVEDGIARWRTLNRCADTPETDHPAPGIIRQRYIATGHQGDVELWLIDGHGHGWPGTRPRLWQRMLKVPVSQAVPATSSVLQFFANHAKP